jgi:RHS repeat-associated protein
MPTNCETLLCRYYYDPLDRLVGSSSSGQRKIQHFYLHNRVVTGIQDDGHHSIIQYGDQLLAYRQSQKGVTKNSLLCTDLARSVLITLDSVQPVFLVFTPFGYHSPGNELKSNLAFNGEQPDPITNHYLLGNGYRAYNPTLMRFNTPDSLSPFARGGLNSYSRVDPVNFYDPTGHWAVGILKNVYNRTLKTIYSLMGQHKKAVKNLIMLGKDFYAYEDIYKGGLRLTFDAHSGVSNGQRFILAGNRRIAGGELKSIASKNNINLDKYNSVRLLVCNSADEINGVSLAQVVANDTNLNTKAYHGTVKADNISNLGYKMQKGETYQPTEKLTTYKKPGPLSYFSDTTSKNYNPITVKPIRQAP